MLHELGAGASLSVADADGDTPTPAYIAAENGHDGCLRVLHELGAGASFSVANANGLTPAHAAASEGHVLCLRVLHVSLSTIIDPIIDPLLRQHETLMEITTSSQFLDDLKRTKALAQRCGGQTPAHFAAARLGASSIECIKFLCGIGGAELLQEELQSSPHEIERKYPCMLAETSLLNIATKHAWLAHCLNQVVGTADTSALSLVAHRSNLLEDLCAQLGVDESTGAIILADAAPRPIDVRFHGESAAGDGLRREWLGEVLKETLDPARGLFVSKDGGRTVQPSPHSATTAGPDHLSYFALLGCVTNPNPNRFNPNPNPNSL